MKWGLVGYGSIGARHAGIIKSFGDDVVVLTKNKECPFKTVSTLQDLTNEKPDRILIANETAKHKDSYQQLRALNKATPILIEKPLFDEYVAGLTDTHAYVAYCLRFHPIVEKVRSLVKDQLVSAHFYVGQYLPTWRPGRDYRETYSAKKNGGGGVLRDLSHELDLALYFGGTLEAMFAQKYRLGDLEIETDDTFTGVFKGKACPLVTVQMNYLDRISQRNFTLVAKQNTYRADFISGEVRINDQVEKVNSERNQMYTSMLKSFREQKASQLTTFAEGLEIMKVISQAGGSV